MKRLFIDLDICSTCEECIVACSYFYHQENNGVASVREYATFTTLCRHCEEAPCVNSCYHQALERASDGHLKRYKMRCTSCKSCTIACPFGVILPDVIPYLDAKCDYCVGVTGQLPKCVTSCPEKALELREEVVEDLEKNIFLVGENLAVHTRKWSREDVQPPKKK